MRLVSVSLSLIAALGTIPTGIGLHEMVDQPDAIPAFLAGSTFAPDWERAWDNGGAHDGGGGVAMDSDGNIFVVFRTLDVGRWLVKFDAEGGVLYQKALPLAPVADVLALPDDSLYVVGWTANRDGEFTVTRLDASGAEIWSVAVPGTGSMGVLDTAMDAAANVLVAGFEGPSGFVFKVSPAGAVVWKVVFPSSVWGVATFPDDRIAAVGAWNVLNAWLLAPNGPLLAERTHELPALIGQASPLGSKIVVAAWPHSIFLDANLEVVRIMNISATAASSFGNTAILVGPHALARIREDGLWCWASLRPYVTHTVMPIAYGNSLLLREMVPGQESFVRAAAGADGVFVLSGSRWGGGGPDVPPEWPHQSSWDGFVVHAGDPPTTLC